MSFERNDEPEVVGDGIAALPAPGAGIALPQLVPPPKPLTPEQIERRRLRAIRWGPPQPELHGRMLTITIVVLVAALGVAVGVFGMQLTTDRYLLVLLLPALVMRRGKLYLRDFGIFAALILIYSELRGVAHLVRPDPFYTPQLNLDKWMFGGYVPTVELQRWFWTGSIHWWDEVLIDTAKLHFLVPPLFAFALWMKRRALFFRFASSMLALSFAAAITFLLFPAAPPWAAGKTLLTPTVTKIDDSSWTSVSNNFSLSKIIEGNPYAAIPSLHAGYAMLCFLFVAWLVWRKSWRWFVIVPATLYPLALSFARVYSGDHYVIDLLAGYLYAVAVFMLVNWYWRRHDFPD